MLGRKKPQGKAEGERLFVSADELRRGMDEADEHTVVVGRIFSSGDRYDGYYESDEWSGPGRELRPFYWWACMNCDVDSGLHASLEAATDDALTHTSDVRHGALPSVLPSGPIRVAKS